VIDIHSHVLHGLDDGSPDLETSLEMLRAAARHGTTDIVASPHANLEYKFVPAVIEAKLNELRASNDSGVRIHGGCDFHLQYENIEDALKHPRRYTIAGQCYLLVEFSDLLILKNTTDIFASLLGAGMRPVITHPERNLLLQQRIDSLREWVAMGCAIQVTSQSLLGHFGTKASRFSHTLMDARLVHAIASDAHDLKRRPPILDEAADYVRKHWSNLDADLLFRDNPAMMLRGEDLLGASQPRPKRFFGLFS
jgi:protein-tyrosine phosphatase